MHAVHVQPERGTIVVISKIFKAVQVIHRTLKPNDKVSHYILYFKQLLLSFQILYSLSKDLRNCNLKIL